MGARKRRGSLRSGRRFEFYKDKTKQWRWRLVHANGHVIADSGEGYRRRADAVRIARGMVARVLGAKLLDLEREVLLGHVS